MSSLIRATRRSAEPQPRRSLPPVLAGLGLGLVNVASFASAQRGIGFSNAFETGVAVAAREVAPDALGVNAYVAESKEAPKLGWEHCVVAGALAGGFLAARGQEPAGGESSPLAAFTGGALVMLGARMAQGCTSGHCLTGTAQRAASSWTFTPVMFAAAAATRQVLRGGAR